MSTYTHGVNINKKGLHFCKPFPYLYCANIKDMTKLSNSIELNKTIPFKSATFCSCIGSPEQSLKELNANHINVFACEKDKFARQTYLANFTPGIMLEDMTKVGQIPGYESNGAKDSSLVQINPSLEAGGKQPYKQNRIYKGDISICIDTESKSYIQLSDYRIRRYTPLETMRLQGYPDNFKKPCSETQQYRMAGNSIPVHLMKAVLKPLMPLLEP